MRIGIEALDFNAHGGGQAVSAEIIKILQHLKHEVVVFADKRFSHEEIAILKKRWQIADVAFAYVPKLNNVSLDSFIFNIVQVRYKIDAYIAAGWLIPTKLMSRLVPTFRYAFAPHTPFMYKKFRVMAARSKVVYLLLRILECAFNAFLDTPGKYARARFTFSNFIKSRYKQYYNVDYGTIPPPVDLSDLHSDNVKDEKSIVCLGRIDEEKNYHIVTSLARAYSNYNFTIIGGLSPSRRNMALFKRLNLASRELQNFKLIVNASREEVVKILARSRYFLHLMRLEHFGIAIVEALMSGMTPIVPSHSGPADVIDNGKFGHCYGSFQKLREYFEEFLVPLDPDRQIARAQEFRKERFTERMTGEIAQFLAGLATQRGRKNE